MIVKLPHRFYRFLWCTEAALALIHVYATYDNPNECCFSLPDNSPAHSGSRIACTLFAGFASTIMRMLMLSIGACEICVDARCRNCCSAWAYHGQLILWPIVMFLPLAMEFMILGPFWHTPAFRVFELLVHAVVWHMIIVHIFEGGIESLGSYGALWTRWPRLRRFAEFKLFSDDGIERIDEEQQEMHTHACRRKPGAQPDPAAARDFDPTVERLV